MTTEIIDRLFLELSQITTAKTAKDLHQEAEIIRLKEAARELLRTLPSHFRWNGPVADEFPGQTAARKLAELVE